MYLWSKFGNPDFNQWWLIMQTNSQTQNGVNFDCEVKFDLEGHGQSSPKTIGILTKVFYTYGPNLVILAWMGDELSPGQTWWRTDGLMDGWTEGRTDAGNDNTRRPILALGKNDITTLSLCFAQLRFEGIMFLKHLAICWSLCPCPSNTYVTIQISWWTFWSKLT